MRAALLLLLALPACTCTGVNRGDVVTMTVGQEWALGRELAAEVDAQTTPLRSGAAQATLDAVGAALAARTEFAGHPWRFTVLDDASANAFALPGGHVYVHAGLLAAAESESELAAVLAHEVSHVVARHSSERMAKAHGLSLLLGLLLGDDPGLARQLAAELVGRGALARFSRTDEREADRLGLRYLAEAGYDPEGMVALFETLTQLRARQPAAFERWFATHPLGEERAEAARTLVAEAPQAVAAPPEVPFAAARAEARRRTARPTATP